MNPNEGAWMFWACVAKRSFEFDDGSCSREFRELVLELLELGPADRLPVLPSELRPDVLTSGEVMIRRLLVSGDSFRVVALPFATGSVTLWNIGVRVSVELVAFCFSCVLGLFSKLGMKSLG